MHQTDFYYFFFNVQINSINRASGSRHFSSARVKTRPATTAAAMRQKAMVQFCGNLRQSSYKFFKLNNFCRILFASSLLVQIDVLCVWQLRKWMFKKQTMMSFFGYSEHPIVCFLNNHFLNYQTNGIAIYTNR